MKYARFLFLLICFVPVTFYMCKNASEKKAGDIQSKDVSSSATLNKETFLKVSDSVPRGTPMDSNALIFFLPKTVMGMNRQSVSSITSDANGFPVSNSTVLYNKDDKSLTITITDVSANCESLSNYVPWTKIQFQNIREDGYEKSIEEGGNKFFEKYDVASHLSTLTVIYNLRIIVKLSSAELSMEDLHLLTK